MAATNSTAWYGPRTPLSRVHWLAAWVLPPFVALAEWRPSCFVRTATEIGGEIGIMWLHCIIVGTLLYLGANKIIASMQNRAPGWVALALLALVPMASAVSSFTFVPLCYRVLPQLSGIQGSVFVRSCIIGGGYLAACLWSVHSQTRLVHAHTRLADEQAQKERSLRLASELRHLALVSRVQPHFLFNALNSVLALIPTAPDKAETTVEKLSGLFRQTLEGSTVASVDLNSELDLVRDYLAIEQVRFGERLRFSIDCVERAQHLPVPPMILQPLVENSIKHCIGRSVEGGELRIAVSIALGGELTIVVEDRAPTTGRSARTPEGTGSGLSTVRERWLLLAGTTFETEQHHDATRSGFRVTLRRRFSDDAVWETTPAQTRKDFVLA